MTSDGLTTTQIRARAQAVGDAITELLVAFAASVDSNQLVAPNKNRPPARLPTLEHRSAWTPAEVAEQIGQPYRAVMRLIASGKLRAVKPGKSYSIPDEALREYLAGRDNEATG